MKLGDMREQGVRNLIASCLNYMCRHTTLIDVSGYPDVIEVQSFGKRTKCAKCGARGQQIDVRPNWKERAGMPDSWEGRDAWKK